MDTLSANLEDTTNAVELATWNRPRSTEELQNFINGHHDRLPDGITIE